VLGAVLDLVADGTLDELSVPAVARRSGVSLATIYRYFPTRDQLISAAAAEPSRQAMDSVERPAPHEGDDELAAFQRAMWHDFSRNLPLLRHQITSEAGREMRTARLERSRELLTGYVARRGINASSPEGERLISLLLLLSGSLALVELVDRQGLDVDAAIEQSTWAIRTLLEATPRTADNPRKKSTTRKAAT
jgi:AcrR family transcriptional regulator